MAGSWSPLRRVIAVARSYELLGGGTITVTAVEIWAGGIVIHYAEDLPEFFAPRAPIAMRPHWEVFDDVGTAYVPRGGGAGGGDEVSLGTWRVATAPPDDAKRLYLRGPGMGDDDRLVVALT